MTKNKKAEMLQKAITVVQMVDEEWKRNHIGLFYYYWPIGIPFTKQSWMNYKLGEWEDIFPRCTLRKAKRIIWRG